MLETINSIVGKNKASIFNEINNYINTNYKVDNSFKEQKVKTKKWKYEYKIVKGSKTLCGFYFADDCLGFMVIFGKSEREKIDSNRNTYSNNFLKTYDETPIYHDGKWVMLELEDLSLLEDIKKLLLVKRKKDK